MPQSTLMRTFIWCRKEFPGTVSRPLSNVVSSSQPFMIQPSLAQCRCGSSNHDGDDLIASSNEDIEIANTLSSSCLDWNASSRRLRSSALPHSYPCSISSHSRAVSVEFILFLQPQDSQGKEGEEGKERKEKKRKRKEREETSDQLVAEGEEVFS